MRILTPDAKIEIMAQWEQWKQYYVGRIPDEPGGKGFPDPEIYDFCDALNKIDGIVTTQSCAGHLHPGETPGESAMWSGQLWIAMSAWTRAAYIDNIHRLQLYPCIGRVRINFIKESHDVADIEFDGMNKGAEAFMYSQHCILYFFKEIGRWK